MYIIGVTGDKSVDSGIVYPYRMTNAYYLQFAVYAVQFDFYFKSLFTFFM